MTIAETVAQIKAAGFSEVKTYAGWIPLEEWTPYGRKQTDTPSVITFRLEGNQILEDPTPAERDFMARTNNPGIFGVWTVR